MRDSISISLPKNIRRELDKYSRKQKMSRSALVAEMLSRYFNAMEFRELNKKMVPKAQSRGIFTEEDVYKLVS